MSNIKKQIFLSFCLFIPAFVLAQDKPLFEKPGKQTVKMRLNGGAEKTNARPQVVFDAKEIEVYEEDEHAVQIEAQEAENRKLKAEVADLVYENADLEHENNKLQGKLSEANIKAGAQARALEVLEIRRYMQRLDEYDVRSKLWMQFNAESLSAQSKSDVLWGFAFASALLGLASIAVGGALTATALPTFVPMVVGFGAPLLGLALTIIFGVSASKAGDEARHAEAKAVAEEAELNKIGREQAQDKNNNSY